MPQLRGFLAIDQYGQKVRLNKHPRKELAFVFPGRSISNMYRDTRTGTRHVGYVLGGQQRGLWFEVFKVHTWTGPSSSDSVKAEASAA